MKLIRLNTGIAFLLLMSVFINIPLALNSASASITPKSTPHLASTYSFNQRLGGIAFDASGNMFIGGANQTGNATYGSGTISSVSVSGTTRTFASNLNGWPDKMSFDPSGNLWVLLFGDTDGTTLLEFNSSGSIIKSVVLLSPGHQSDAGGLAIDSSGNVFAAINDQDVSGNALGLTKIIRISSSGTQSTFSTLSSSVGFINGMTFTPSGTLYVVSYSPSTNAYSFGLIDNSGNFSSISLGLQIAWPQGLASDSYGNIYIPETDSGVLIVRAGTSTATMFSSIANNNENIAVSPSGQVYLTQYWGTVSLIGTASAPPTSAPGVPTNVTATGTSSSITVSWLAPTATGYPVSTINYTVSSSPGTLTCTTSSTSCTVSGITGGTTYTFSVTASNSTGVSSISSSSNSVTSGGVPSAPAPVTLGQVSNGTMAIYWQPPSSTGGTPITAYTVTATDGVNPITCTPTAVSNTSCTLLGLSIGVTYSISVTATNSSGTSSASTPVTGSVGSAAPSAPAPVTLGQISNGTIAIYWQPPSSTGGTPITAYTVIATGGTAPVTCAPTSVSNTSCTLVGLSAGITYSISVTATNSVGTSLASTPVSSTSTPTVPGTPTSVTATASGTTAIVSWTAPSSIGGSAISNYTVTSSPGSLTCTSASTSCTVNGLISGTSYTFTVTATNTTGVGLSSVASNSISSLGTPGAPTNATATSSNGGAYITWSAPSSTGGSAISNYTVTSSPGSLTCTSASTSCTVNGLISGTSYTFTVTATNTSGTSTSSSVSNSITVTTVPGVPTNVTATAGDQAALVSWSAPSSSGGLAISSYTVTVEPGHNVYSANTTSITITGLTNGTMYSFVVVANNSSGIGPTSATSNSVTPSTAPTTPSSPINVAATAGDTSATISWSQPLFTGTNPITSYTVTVSPGIFSCTTSQTVCTITGLTNKTRYIFQVQATNGVGTGPSINATAAAVPMPSVAALVASLLARTPTTATISVQGSPAVNGSPVVSYSVSTDGGKSFKTIATGKAVPKIQLTGLKSKTTYKVVVVAVSKKGKTVNSKPIAVSTV